jgi:hypothetical protein
VCPIASRGAHEPRNLISGGVSPAQACVMRAVRDMMTVMAPRPRRARRDLTEQPEQVELRGRVSPEVKEKADAAAAAAGISTAWYLEQLVLRDAVDDSGCPVWLQGVRPRGRSSRHGRAHSQQELPLMTA